MPPAPRLILYALAVFFLCFAAAAASCLPGAASGSCRFFLFQICHYILAPDPSRINFYNVFFCWHMSSAGRSAARRRLTPCHPGAGSFLFCPASLPGAASFFLFLFFFSSGAVCLPDHCRGHPLSSWFPFACLASFLFFFCLFLLSALVFLTASGVSLAPFLGVPAGPGRIRSNRAETDPRKVL